MSEETTNMTLQPPSHSSSSSETLPLDLVTEIMCWLPVKFLLQLCCVCKSWNYIISHDSNFAKKHLSLSTSNHHRRHLILTPTRTSREFLLSDFQLSSIFSSSVSTPSVTQLRYPLLPIKGYSFGAISNYDGMFCFGIDESLALLFNPSIRKFKMLPPLENPDRDYAQTFYTLAYDRFANIYKIIAVSFPDKQEKQVHVHTLGTHYWRRIQDIPYNCIFCGLGIFVSDTINWLAYDVCSSLWIIVSLDLKKECYQKLSQPLYDHGFDSNMVFGELRGCLCILAHGGRLLHGGLCVDVWIMNEYGNEQSWNKLLSVPYRPGLCGFSIYSKVVYISEDGQVLMEFLKNGIFSLLVYDSRNDTFKVPEIENLNGWMTSNIHVESLISPFSQY
jgi:F-box interacting protein